MIAEGVDGLSQADHGLGVMTGKYHTQFLIPLHLDPVVREPKVSEWIKDATCDLDFKVLTPSEWFDDTHIDGNFVWTIPTVAAKVVLEQLGFICLKCPNSMCRMDGYSRLEDKEVWSLTHHYEPLLIYLCLPFCSSNPKLQEWSCLLEQFSRTLYEQQVPQIPSLCRQDILRQLFCATRKLSPCEGCWCGACYKTLGIQDFHIHQN
jgi:hypothetical protein